MLTTQGHISLHQISQDILRVCGYTSLSQTQESLQLLVSSALNLLPSETSYMHSDHKKIQLQWRSVFHVAKLWPTAT